MTGLYRVRPCRHMQPHEVHCDLKGSDSFYCLQLERGELLSEARQLTWPARFLARSQATAVLMRSSSCRLFTTPGTASGLALCSRRCDTRSRPSAALPTCTQLVIRQAGQDGQAGDYIDERGDRLAAGRGVHECMTLSTSARSLGYCQAWPHRQRGSKAR